MRDGAPYRAPYGYNRAVPVRPTDQVEISRYVELNRAEWARLRRRPKVQMGGSVKPFRVRRRVVAATCRDRQCWLPKQAEAGGRRFRTVSVEVGND